MNDVKSRSGEESHSSDKGKEEFVRGIQVPDISPNRVHMSGKYKSLFPLFLVNNTNPTPHPV